MRDRDRGGFHRRRRLWQADPAPAKAPKAFSLLVRKRVRNVIGYCGIRAMTTVSERRRGAAQGRPRASSSPSSPTWSAPPVAAGRLMALFEGDAVRCRRSPDPLRGFPRSPSSRRASGIRCVASLGRIPCRFGLRGQRCVVADCCGDCVLTSGGRCEGPSVRVVLSESAMGTS